VVVVVVVVVVAAAGWWWWCRSQGLVRLLLLHVHGWC
jgi:hypothetical protein